MSNEERINMMKDLLAIKLSAEEMHNKLLCEKNVNVECEIQIHLETIYSIIDHSQKMIKGA